MHIQERLPGPCAPACRYRFNAVGFQDIANGGVADVVADIRFAVFSLIVSLIALQPLQRLALSLPNQDRPAQ